MSTASGDGGDAVGERKTDFASTAVDAVQAVKQPPQEPPASVTTRRLVVLSFWLVVLLLGVPTWWTTTTVYRASLPLQRMHDWSEGKICSAVFPLHVTLDIPTLPRVDAQTLLQSTQHSLDDLNEFPAHHIRLSLPEGRTEITGESRISAAQNGSDTGNALPLDTRTALVIQLVQDTSATTPIATLKPQTNILDVSYSPVSFPTSGTSSSVLGTFLATKLQQLFMEEQTLLASLRDPSSAEPISRRLSPEIAASLAKRTSRSVKYAPTYHLTFSLFTPTGSPSSWDIEGAVDAIFGPILYAMSGISNFTIDSQVQPYAALPPNIQPIHEESRGSWTLGEQALGGFINAAEWPLTPSIGAGPTINFVLYAAPPSTSPLEIDNSPSNSWLVPQWGGVAIYNSDAARTGNTHPNFLASEDIEPALFTFSTQLMSLLGVPLTPQTSLPMRLSTLARVRAASLFLSASSTLGSLARLVSTLPSISIPDSVADNVSATMTRLEAACTSFKEGDFHLALQHGKAAEQHAEKAFFEKSMVGQVYFPDEHKVAVYLPLLGPVAVPLLVAAIREIRPFLQGLRRSSAS